MHLADFFSHGQSAMQLTVFTIVFLICWNLENLFGVSENYGRWQHDHTNFSFIATGAVSQLLLGLLFAKGLQYTGQHHLGFLGQWGIVSTAGQITVAFLVWDLYYYLYHAGMHKFKLVWRFHAIHHSDTVMNVSTSLREHPGETLLRLGTYMLISCMLSPAVWIVGLHQFLQVVSKIIVHSNWRLPEKVDRWMSLLFLTPNMHHVHHHNQQPYTDSNYGDLFSVWDRLFGTYRHLSASKVRFGLDVMPASRYDLGFKNLMFIPFKRDFNPSISDICNDLPEVQIAPLALPETKKRPIVAGAGLMILLVGTSFTFSGQSLSNIGASGDMVFHLSGLTPNHGYARVVLYNDPDKYLTRFGFCAADSVQIGATGTADIVLHNLPFGNYAGSFYQDENHNYVIDRSWSGIPTEPYAFSNGVRAKWSIPSFRSVSFAFDQSGEHQEVTLKYWSNQ